VTARLRNYFHLLPKAISLLRVLQPFRDFLSLIQNVKTHILTLTWPRFAGMLLAVYILINLVFAGLYLLGGNCIAELLSGSFWNAFFFSVETLNTVGYGHMYPDTFYGHFVTTVEVVIGMAGVAVITGLIFIRFSRPTAKILFSKSAVITPFDGVPTLMLRVANVRHVAMAEAEFRVMLFRMSRSRKKRVLPAFIRLSFSSIGLFPFQSR
jgi:inward rectifier potassium channel